jgi:hypothetical protein
VPKHAKPAKGKSLPPAIAVTLRGSEAWKAWIERGAKFCRTDVAKLIDASVIDYLKGRGFEEEAPAR